MVQFKCLSCIQHCNFLVFLNSAVFTDHILLPKHWPAPVLYHWHLQTLPVGVAGPQQSDTGCMITLISQPVFSPVTEIICFIVNDKIQYTWQYAYFAILLQWYHPYNVFFTIPPLLVSNHIWYLVVLFLKQKSTEMTNLCKCIYHFHFYKVNNTRLCVW